MPTRWIRRKTLICNRMILFVGIFGRVGILNVRTSVISMIENPSDLLPDMCLRRVNWKSSAVLAPRKLSDGGEHKHGRIQLMATSETCSLRLSCHGVAAK